MDIVESGITAFFVLLMRQVYAIGYMITIKQVRMRINILIFSLLSVVDIIAQSVHGKILDEYARPISYANVVLLSRDSVFIDGTVTSENGDFIIESTKPEIEVFKLKVSSLGFETVCLDCKDPNVGEIKLRTKINMLSEIIITPPSYTLKGNGLVVSVQNSSLSSLEDIGKMLDFIPGIQSNNEGIYVFGKGKPIVYLNGRILYDLSELERLRPSDISSVEIIGNSGAAYSSSSQAVVKIKTIRKKGDGLSMDLRSYFQLAHKMRFGDTFQVNYRAERFDVFSYLNYLHADDFEIENSCYDVKSADPFTLDNSQKKT